MPSILAALLLIRSFTPPAEFWRMTQLSVEMISLRRRSAITVFKSAVRLSNRRFDCCSNLIFFLFDDNCLSTVWSFRFKSTFRGVSASSTQLANTVFGRGGDAVITPAVVDEEDGTGSAPRIADGPGNADVETTLVTRDVEHDRSFGGFRTCCFGCKWAGNAGKMDGTEFSRNRT